MPRSRGVLADAFRYAAEIGSCAVVAMRRGMLLGEWGETARKVEVASVRKSLLSALIGIAVARNAIALDATLADLGIDDSPAPLTAAEKAATVADLLAARSGVYHPAVDQDPAVLPPRGSHAPGSYWFYNNWDFNVLGVIYERAVGRRIGPAFAEHIAAPLGLQDFVPDDVLYKHAPLSIHPAYKFRASARDLARFGQLFLQGGIWSGYEVVPPAWVRDSTRPHSDFGNGRGYGYMWWTGEGPALAPELDFRGPSFWAAGQGGQFVFVLPWCHSVIIRLAAETGGDVTDGQIARLLSLALAAGDQAV